MTFSPTVRSALLALFALAPLAAQEPAPRVAWSPSVDAAFEQARKEGKPVMWVVMMDGEIACRRMMDNVYTDAAVIARTKEFVVVPCSLGRHNRSGGDESETETPCGIFPGVTCSQHRANELVFRERYETRREVISPQHVFTDPTGQILSRKDWELNSRTLRDEMDKAMNAWKRLQGRSDETPAAEAPGDSPAPAVAPDAPARISAEETRLLSVLLRAPSQEKKECADAFYQVAGSAAYAALADAILAKEVKRSEDLATIVRAAGKPECSAGAKEFARLLDDKNKVVRHTAVVTLEEMEDPSVVAKLLEIYEQDRTLELRRDILRALGPLGRGNEQALALLLKEVQNSNPKMVRSAAMGLGNHLSGNQEVRDALQKAFLRTGDDLVKKAILYAYLVGRDESAASDLDGLAEKERNKEIKDLIETTRNVLQGRPNLPAGEPGGGGRRGGGRGGEWRNMMRSYRSLFEDPVKDDPYPRNRNVRDLMRSLGMGGGFGGGGFGGGEGGGGF